MVGHTKLVWTQSRGGYSPHSFRPLIFLLHNTYIEDRASPSSTYKERLYVYLVFKRLVDGKEPLSCRFPNEGDNNLHFTVSLTSI